MKHKHWFFVAAALVFLGNGCETPPPQTTTVVNDSPVEVENDDPYGKAEAAFDEVAETIEPSGQLDFSQQTYSIEDRLSWYEKLNWPKACEAEYRLSSNREDGGLAFYKISDQTYVMRVDCYLAAYQKGMVFMLVNTDGKNISGAQLEEQVYNPTTKTVMVNTDNEGQFLGFDSFDVKTKTLSIFTKSRGVGDCGSRNTYRLKNTDLELIKVASLSCEAADEFHLKNPEAEEMPAWPVIYEKK